MNENAYAIIARWRRMAKMIGLSKEDIDSKIKEAMSGDYENLKKILAI